MPLVEFHEYECYPCYEINVSEKWDLWSGEFSEAEVERIKRAQTEFLAVQRMIKERVDPIPDVRLQEVATWQNRLGT